MGLLGKRSKSLKLLTITPETFIELLTFEKRERLIFGYLFMHRNFKTLARWTYYKSYKNIADATGLSEANTRNAIFALQRKGWLSKPEVKRESDIQGKQYNIYRWQMPKHEQEVLQAKYDLDNPDDEAEVVEITSQEKYENAKEVREHVNNLLGQFDT